MDLESFVTLVAAAGMTTGFGQQETIPPHEPPTAISPNLPLSPRTSAAGVDAEETLVGYFEFPSA